MVVASLDKSEQTRWLIKGQHRLGNKYPVGEEVINGSIIRLEHCFTKRNLHSHGDRLSPLTKQQEVTCIGTNGSQDDNDDWIIEIPEGGGWHFGQKVKLIHVTTRNVLHSHGGQSHPVFTNGEQEVTAFQERDDNDFWIAESLDEAIQNKHGKQPPLGTDVPSQSSTPQPSKVPDPVTIAGSSVSDLPTTKDSLGFAPYVQAVAQFLLHENTTAPLTMSVEGEWGSGKSSFMKQLKNALEQQAAETGKKSTKKRFPVRTVWFNPWRHDKNDELWSAFALEFIKQLAAERCGVKNIVDAWKLNRMRVSDWGGILWEAFRFATIVVVWMIIAGVIIINAFTGTGGLATVVEQITGDQPLPGNLTWLFTSGSLLGVAVFAVIVIKKINEFVGSPLEHDFKKYVDAPNYSERTAFIERFHDDFKNIVTAYADGAQVFVFIDDLDRCEVPKAAELMQAINLMISDEAPIFFIIGMDREKVAAGVAAKHEKLLPFLAQSASTTEQNKANTTDGLVYGLSFVEKFIQLSFRVPVPGPDNMTQFFANLQSKKANSVAGEKFTSTGTPASAQLSPGNAMFHPQDVIPPSQPLVPTIEAQMAFALKLADDSKLIEKLCEMVAPALDYNPRRLKQFINAFRLKAYICFNTGLLDTDDTMTGKCITLPMLAKFIAISLRWPLFLNHVAEGMIRFYDPDSSEGAVFGIMTLYWRSKPRFVDLLNFRPGKNGVKLADWDLSSFGHKAALAFDMSYFDVNRLLRISPLTRRTPVPEPELPTRPTSPSKPITNA